MGTSSRGTGAGRETRSAVIDIGSNSVRLVVYAGTGRAPTPLFNEKSMCGLGRGLSDTGRLNEEGMRAARDALRRFAAVVGMMGVRDLQVVATAACRDAENGPEFVASIERETAFAIRILDGEEEAHYSSLGVLAGQPDADGIVGDIGGGSLELIDLSPSGPGAKISLPLGPFRLPTASYAATKAHVDDALKAVPWIERARGRSLIAVGGAWRAIAKLHMAQSGYPLRIIHHYRLPAAEASEFTRLLGKQSRESLQRLGELPRRRLDVLGPTALVLRRLIKIAQPSELVFSAYGLREGLEYARLSPKERAADPLVAFCRAAAQREGRFKEHGRELEDFTAPLFAGEDEAQHRLRIAAALLSDVAWRTHPDHRGEQAFNRILHAPFGGIDHAGRIFIALAVFARYAGTIEDPVTQPLLALLPPEVAQRALHVGLALRLAHTISAATPGILPRLHLVTDGPSLTLDIPQAQAGLVGETVVRRHDALARALGRVPIIRHPA
ncbi:MAG: Ppx/GppA family phosphatase [Alphaproteobacteria bacterium]|jgi:exopolyphosphatase/guanosine-5'-triphosphate,3'-diphosphate pyrophosphatase|nr:Ppx/GppA family phosphatase [Alphaproteobacteria bacterium]